MLDVFPYEPCPCGSQKKHKFCCKPLVDKALLLVKMGKEWEAEEYFGVELLKKWVANDPNPERQQEWKEILDSRIKFGPQINP